MGLAPAGGLRNKGKMSVTTPTSSTNGAAPLKSGASRARVLSGQASKHIYTTMRGYEIKIVGISAMLPEAIKQGLIEGDPEAEPPIAPWPEPEVPTYRIKLVGGAEQWVPYDEKSVPEQRPEPALPYRAGE